MKKETIEKLMERHGILECEVTDAIEFVSDLLCNKARETKENEPYATNTIDRLERASNDVYDLVYDIDEVM